MRKKLETYPSGVAPSVPPVGEVRRQLARIVGSTVLRDSLRLTHFLTFVVETTLAGDSDRIKAYTIAVGALDRSSDFDPQTDPIVRVEAGRLRQALSRYYADLGRDDALVIELPRGTYVPIFRLRDANGWAPPVAPRHPEPGFAPPPVTQISAQVQGLRHTIAEFHQLTAIHRLRLAAVRAEIASAQQTLLCSRELLRTDHNTARACPPDLPLLPTAPSSQPEALRTADGRQIETTEEAPSATAAWARGPRTGGDRRDAAHDRDDPHGLRALRVRAGRNPGYRIY
jgi:hypothetical protein